MPITPVAARVVTLCTTLLVAVGAGCADKPASYAYLFDPVTTTPGPGLYGVWAGAVGPLEVRIELRADRFTFANRCAGRVVGVSVAAAIDGAKLEVRESRKAGDKKCHADATAGTMPPCAGAPPGEACFAHDGLRLVMRNGAAELALTKQRD